MSWLPVPEFSYNNTPLSSTLLQLSPLLWFLDISFLDPFWWGMDFLTRAKASQACSHNRGRRVADHFLPGDLVWLSCGNLKKSRPSNKLNVWQVELFAVDQMVGTNAVKLVLPSSFPWLHPVFNFSLITRYLPPASTDWASDLPVITCLADDFLASNTFTCVLGFQNSPANVD